MARDTVERLEKGEIERIYKTYMKRDFPMAELKPLSHILKSVDEGYGFVLGLYEDGVLMGYAVFVLCEETKCALLDYFAILSEKRGQGLGHRAFPLFREYFTGELPDIDGLYIESEEAAAAKNEKQRLVRERRIAFYRSCGCIMTNLRSVLFGVEYSVFYLPFGGTAGEARLEDLDTLYRRMFKPRHYEHFVSLSVIEESGGETFRNGD